MQTLKQQLESPRAKELEKKSKELLILEFIRLEKRASELFQKLNNERLKSTGDKLRELANIVDDLEN